MLTSRQKQAYDFIKTRLLETGRSPTYADIGYELGCNKVNVHHLVSQLVDRGFVSRQPNRSRGLSLVQDKLRYFVPTPDSRPWVTPL